MARFFSWMTLPNKVEQHKRWPLALHVVNGVPGNVHNSVNIGNIGAMELHMVQELALLTIPILLLRLVILTVDFITEVSFKSESFSLQILFQGVPKRLILVFFKILLSP